MNTFPSWFNTAAYALIFGLLIYAVMSRYVRDGIVIKTGMAVMALGYFGLICLQAEYWQSAQASAWCHAFIHSGILVVVFGYWMRQWQGRNRRRRTTDFADLGRQ